MAAAGSAEEGSDLELECEAEEVDLSADTTMRRPAKRKRGADKELKALVRKQSNREAARRSRMRKAAEAEESTQRLQQAEALCARLEAEKEALRQQLLEVLAAAEKLAADKDALVGEVRRLGGALPPGVGDGASRVALLPAPPLAAAAGVAGAVGGAGGDQM